MRRPALAAMKKYPRSSLAAGRRPRHRRARGPRRHRRAAARRTRPSSGDADARPVRDRSSDGSGPTATTARSTTATAARSAPASQAPTPSRRTSAVMHEDRTEVIEDPRAGLEDALYELKRVIVGQDAMLERLLVALLAGGHVLLEGVPGLAKTLTVKTLAEVLGGSFRRVQFTPDLVPVRPRRHARLPPGHGPLRHRARPGLRQLPARRRDQPRARQGAVARCSRSCRSAR